MGVPGGGVQDGETLIQACQREYREETGLEVTCTSLAVTADCIFRMGDGRLGHDLTFYFTVRPAAPQLPLMPIDSLEPHLQFRWIPLDNLDVFELVPEHLALLLPRLEDLPSPLFVTFDARHDGDMLSGTRIFSGSADVALGRKDYVAH